MRKLLRTSALAAALALPGAAGSAEERAGRDMRSDIVVQALALLGTPYRYGGGSPESGFDCSGLVRHVFGSVLNRDLPRRAEEMRAIGESVSRSELQPGDLVFFDTLRRAFSHVAIYVGEGRFVHAPARNGRVRVEGLDDRYWAARYNGARRLMPARPAEWAAASRPAPPKSSAAGFAFGVDDPPKP